MSAPASGRWHWGIGRARWSKQTIVWRAGNFVFETGDINHTVYNKTDAPMVHILFERLPADLNGPSLIPAKHHETHAHGAPARQPQPGVRGCGLAPLPLTARHCESPWTLLPHRPHLAVCSVLLVRSRLLGTRCAGRIRLEVPA